MRVVKSTMSVVTRSSLKRKEREISIQGGIDAHASKRRTGVAKEGNFVCISCLIGATPILRDDDSKFQYRQANQSELAVEYR